MKQLLEAISSSAFPKASSLILTYLRKQVSPHIYTFPETEHFKSGSKVGAGIRYFVRDKESIRLNWLSDSSIDASKNLISFTYWDGSNFVGRPTYTVTFDKAQSLVKSLPFIANFLKAPRLGEFLYVENDDVKESVLLNMSNPDFSYIVEAKNSSGDAMGTIDNVIRGFSEGMQIKDMYATGAGNFGPGMHKVIQTIRNLYPKLFEKQGVTVMFASNHNAKKIDRVAVANAMGAQGAVGGKSAPGAMETIMPSKEVEAMEHNLPRLAFEEQLNDLRRAMVLLMNNATQSLYLAGRGGIGKTQTVEEELAKRGLTDGEGYFKITGSASTAGIYRILYTHRKDILLFDDSDGALADQDSRNLFKAASDTKKVRKIAWMKAGKNYVDPADMDEDEEDPDILPRYFDFTGKIIFISNLKMDKLDPDGALRTRGYVLNIDPTDEEVYNYMDKIVSHIKLDVNYELNEKQRKEVINILRSRKGKEGSVNLRQLVRGLNTMAGILAGGGTDWQNMVLRYA